MDNAKELLLHELELLHEKVWWRYMSDDNGDVIDACYEMLKVIREEMFYVRWPYSRFY